MKILFLDQSGKPGGAELCLLDVAKPYRDRCLVGLLADGSFRELLEQQGIPVQVLTGQSIQVQKDSNLLKGLSSLGQLLPLSRQIAQLSRDYDVIYANTQKALVVGAIASFLANRPLIYHLHDIVSAHHFSAINRKLIVTLANRASLVIANSHASAASFVAAGGNRDRVKVVYNGFDLQRYQHHADTSVHLRQTLGLDDRFVVGHFSRLSPWKGQHVLIEALTHCSENVTALLVGDALFGEDAYVDQLHQQVEQLGLSDRVQFLGFRSDIPQLMTMCDLVAHTSTAPEPFGRVIIEAMLCGTPIVAAAAGGVVELIEQGKTGWLSPPGDALKLAEIIQHCQSQPEHAIAIAHPAQQSASERFNLETTNQQIAHLLSQVIGDRG